MSLRSSLRSTLCLLAFLTFSSHAFAWSERGHAIVAETAAYLVAEEPGAEFMKTHSFSLGYYSNVPDKVWKSPATFSIEESNHFMDMEIFVREFKQLSADKPQKPFELDRVSFDSAFPSIPNSAGRAFWRVREFADLLAKTTEELKKTDLTSEQRHAAQARWLVLAGTMGHYVGDLAQPLHTTENYDGQMTDQKGVHGFFEGAMVDETFPGVECDAAKLAHKQWKAYKAKYANASILQILESLSSESNANLEKVLKTDRKLGRKDLKKAAAAQREMIVKRLAAGSLALAELWRRDLGWQYDGKRFYTFVPAPEYIYPPGVTPTQAPAPAASPAKK